MKCFRWLGGLVQPTPGGKKPVVFMFTALVYI